MNKFEESLQEEAGATEIDHALITSLIRGMNDVPGPDRIEPGFCPYILKNVVLKS